MIVFQLWTLKFGFLREKKIASQKKNLPIAFLQMPEAVTTQQYQMRAVPQLIQEIVHD